jgi:ABC-type transporter Mla MlaB component
MADPKDGESFFRKVVRFVANPATDWSDVATRQDDGNELEKSELKAMVERKRRNDFVRKRELDTLRKLRRDGLSPEQLAALGGSSKVDDSEVRLSDGAGARADVGVKAKIDEIEQQMVGEQVPREPVVRQRPAPRRAPVAPQHPTDFYTAPTEPAAFERHRPPPAMAPATAAAQPPAPGALDGMPSLPTLPDSHFPPAVPPRVPGVAPLRSPPPGVVSTWAPASKSAPRPTDRTDLLLPDLPVQPIGGAGLPRSDGSFDPNSRFAVEVNEVVHDPELDEAVIAFANADFNQCEQALTNLCQPNAARGGHAETWLVLFDLYRATGQQHKFESLSLEFANRFDRSSPQWYSLPRRVADAAADERPDTRGVKGDIGWVSPAVLDVEAVGRLRSSTLQLPLPWVLDWSALESVDAEAASQLHLLFRQWAPQPIDMRWIDADRLLQALQDAAPTGVRDADPAFWMVRLEALRLSNRPDQFDETAIDYCVTYEVSPPSWERARCQVRGANATNSTTTPTMSIVSEVHSSFLESGLLDDSHAGQEMATVELSGQLSGDIGGILQQLDRKLGAATLVQVSCARLIRVDFIAAGDLLNWVLAKQSENRSITFQDAHRLVALFFGAMGINEHARVQVPRD